MVTRRPVRTSHLPVIALLLIGLWQVPVHHMRPGLTHLPGTLIDNRLNNYILEHGYRWVIGKEKTFWDAPFAWPVKTMTARSDAHLGELPAYAAARFLGAGPERAFQLCVLLFFTANYLGCVWALRRFGLTAIGAAAGAYLFAFGLPVAEHMGHLQLLPRFMVPPAFLFAWLFAWQPTWKSLLGLAACIVGQFYLTMYLGVLLVGMLGALGALIVLINRGRLPWRELLLPGATEGVRRFAIVAGSAATLMPLLGPHMRMASTTELIPRDRLVEFIPESTYWFRSIDGSLLWNETPMLFAGAASGFALLFGLGCLLRGAAGPGRRGIAAVMVLLALSVPLVVVKHPAWSPYEHLLSLPLVGTLRAIGRITLIQLFPLAVVLGFGVDAVTGFVLRRYGTPAAVGVSTLLLGLLVVDQRLTDADNPYWSVRRYSVAEAVARRETLAEAIREEIHARGGRCEAVCVFPEHAAGWDLETMMDGMAAAQQVGVPTLNCWTGYPPKGCYPFHNFTAVEVWLRNNGLTLAMLKPGIVIIGQPIGLEADANEAQFRKDAGGSRPRPAFR